MDKAQWTEVESCLRNQYHSVKLSIDGYEVCLILMPYKGLKQCIAVYVNGFIKGEWVFNDCEIRRRFYNRHTKSLLRTAEFNKLPAKMKKDLKKDRAKYEYEYFEPYWMSFNRMKSHFIKNNKNIEIITKPEV